MQSTHQRTTIIAAAAALAVGIGSLVAVGCEGNDSTASPGAGLATTGQTSVSGAPTITVGADPLQIKVGRVAGHLSRQNRRLVVKRIGSVVDSWFRGGFVDGDYPRADFTAAWERFTAGAAAQAKQQQEVTTNAVLGPELLAVVPTRRRARLAIFAPHGRAAGATADVTLVLAGLRQDQSQVELTVTGQLFLTKDSGWQVFGFDVQRSVGAVGAYVQSRQAKG